MAQNQKSYDNEFKAQAVKLAQEISGHKAAQELGIPKGTIVRFPVRPDHWLSAGRYWITKSF